VLLNLKWCLTYKPCYLLIAFSLSLNFYFLFFSKVSGKLCNKKSTQFHVNSLEEKLLLKVDIRLSIIQHAISRELIVGKIITKRRHIDCRLTSTQFHMAIMTKFSEEVRVVASTFYVLFMISYDIFRMGFRVG
jgi:hypothetical protein